MSKKIKDEDIDENVYLGLRAAPRPHAAMTRPKGSAQQIINTPTAQQNQSVSQAVNVSVSPVTEGESDFDGGVLDYIGMNFASLFLFIITLTLGLAWVICYRKRWHTHHTIVQGRVFLTLITIGIYGFWLPVKIKKWYAKHLEFDSPV